MKITSRAACALLIIGGLNALCVALFSFNAIFWAVAYNRTAINAIYALIGVSALWLIFALIAFKPFKNLS